MFAVRYELGFCIPEYGILHSHRREYHKSYIILCVFKENFNEFIFEIRICKQT
jgi:hypothetical protein